MQVQDVTVSERKYPKMNRGWNARAMREYHQHPRVHVRVSDENVLDNLCNRFARPHIEYRKLVLKPVCEALGVNPTDVSFTWSQKAGCRCGCSPAFIVKRKDGATLGLRDVYVDVTGDDARVDPSKNPRDANEIARAIAV